LARVIEILPCPWGQVPGESSFLSGGGAPYNAGKNEVLFWGEGTGAAGNSTSREKNPSSFDERNHLARMEKGGSGEATAKERALNWQGRNPSITGLGKERVLGKKKDRRRRGKCSGLGKRNVKASSDWKRGPLQK